MSHLSRTILCPLFIAAVSICGMSATTPSIAQETAAQAETEAISFTLKAGEVLQIIAPQSRAGARDTRQDYYDFVLPQAEALGFQRLGGLGVRRKVVSDFDPGAFLFFSWPDAASLAQFEAHPEWPAYRDRRPDDWEELKIYTVEMDSDLSLRFDPDKHYTVVVAWLDGENGEDYSRYLDGIEPAVERAGGRFVAKFHHPAYETNAGTPQAPGQITFVEWDTPDGFARVQASEEYRASQPSFASGVEKFEFYWLGL